MSSIYTTLVYFKINWHDFNKLNINFRWGKIYYRLSRTDFLNKLRIDFIILRYISKVLIKDIYEFMKNDMIKNSFEMNKD